MHYASPTARAHALSPSVGGLAQRAAVATLSVSETERQVEVAPLAGPMVMRTVVLTGVWLGAASQGHTSWFCTHATVMHLRRVTRLTFIYTPSLCGYHAPSLTKHTWSSKHFRLWTSCARVDMMPKTTQLQVSPCYLSVNPPTRPAVRTKMLVAMRSRNFEPSQNRVSLPAP